MPLYTYRCISGHETEELRKMSDRERHGVCPMCKQETPTRVILSLPSQVRFGIPGVKGHYRRTVAESEAAKLQQHS